MVNYDDELSALLQNSGHLVPFLDAFFGFLYRRTDFFCVREADDDRAKVGFEDGSAEKILLGVFRRWQSHAHNERDISQRLKSGNVPPVAQEVEVVAAAEPDFRPIPNVTERVKPDPRAATDPSSRRDESESFNGADVGHYKWSQTSADLDVTIDVDGSIRKGTQIQVDVRRDELKVSTKDGKILLEGRLFAPVKHKETLWNLVPGKQISLSLEKAAEQWWSKLLLSEENSVDSAKLHVEQPVEQMTSADKMAVEEALFRQQQQLKKNEELESLLREAWDKDGSPFKGQPFDPSVLNNVQS